MIIVSANSLRDVNSTIVPLGLYFFDLLQQVRIIRRIEMRFPYGRQQWKRILNLPERIVSKSLVLLVII